MADKVTVTVDLHGVEEDLIQVGPKLAKRTFRAALKTVGEFWKNELVAMAPEDEGGLKGSINYVIKTSPNEDNGTVTVGPTYTPGKRGKMGSASPGVYAKFVEFGLKVREYAFKPFMRPVFDGSAEAMIIAFAAKLKENLEDALR